MIEQKIITINPLIYGQDLANLNDQLKWQIAFAVSDLLKQHQGHMLQFNGYQLVEKFINPGLAVAMWDYQSKTLMAFAKNAPWPGINEYGQQVLEFGSWITAPGYENKGIGTLMAKAAAITANCFDPNSQLIAVCAGDNTKPIDVLKKLGAIETDKPSNVQILLGEGQAKVIVLDMSHLNL